MSKEDGVAPSSFIIEIGNYCGGNLLAMAHLCDILGKGRARCLAGVDRA